MIAIRNDKRVINPLVADQSVFTALIVAGAFILMMLTTYAIDRFSEVQHSGWDMVSQMAPWYVSFMSGYLIFTYIPMWIANGKTRRHAFQTWLVVAGLISGIAAASVTVGVPLERLWYRRMDFRVTDDVGYGLTNSDNVLVIFPSLFLVYAIWAAVGGMIGIAVYRFKEWGWLMMVPGILVLSFAGTWTDDGGGFLALLRRVIKDFEYNSTFVSILIAIAFGVLTIGITWLVTRTLPLRNK